MFKKFVSIMVATLIAVCVTAGQAEAKDDHTTAALEQASLAVEAKQPESVSKHATEALRHTSAAMLANKRYQSVVNHIEQSESHLKAAIDFAEKGDMAWAVYHANEAKAHLQTANK